MSKKLLLILLSGFFIVTSKLTNANAAQEKSSLILFSQMKQLRSLFPDKSTFETNEEYKEKINSINLAPPHINLDFVPYSGKYDPQKQQLKISLPTAYANLEDYLPEADKIFAKEVLYDSSLKFLIKYRTDQIFRDKEIVTCVNGFGSKSQYNHWTSHDTQYLINVIEKIDTVSIKMNPDQAKRYFDSEENFLNDRLIRKLFLRPISPFYSYFTYYESDPCNNETGILSELYGNNSLIRAENNHLIHSHLNNLKVVERITGKNVFDTSFINK